MLVFGVLYAIPYHGLLYAIADHPDLYVFTYIELIYAIAYYGSMDTIARSPKQVGASIRRYRRQKPLTQEALAALMHVRQATVSKLEAGEPATQLRVLMDALAAMNLELVIRPRTKSSVEEIEDLF